MKYFVYAFVFAVTIGLVALSANAPQPLDVLNNTQPVDTQDVQADNLGGTSPVAGHTYNLSGAGVSSSATSITLASLTIKQTGQPIQDSDLSSTFYITIEPGNTSRQEIVSCTTVGANTGSSVTLSGCVRGLSPITPYAASSSLQFSHGGGAVVIFSDPPQLFNEYTAKSNDETITGSWTFSTLPTSTTQCSSSSQFCNYASLAALSLSGAATSTETILGLVELATAAEAGSSTPTSASGRPLALYTRYATSSPYTTGSWTVVSQPNGKIKQSFMDLSEAWAFTGRFTVPATTANPFVLNSLSYRFPATHNASSSILSNDSAGNLSWNPIQVAAQDNGSSLTSTASTATTTLYTAVIPANTLSTTKSIRVTAMFGAYDEICYGQIFFGNGTASSTISYAPNNSGVAVTSGMIYATSTTAQASTFTSTFGTQSNFSDIINTVPLNSGTTYITSKLMPYNTAATTYIAFAQRNKVSATACTLIGHTVEVITSL